MDGLVEALGRGSIFVTFEERLAHLLVQRRLDDMLLDRARVEGRLRRLAV